ARAANEGTAEWPYRLESFRSSKINSPQGTKSQGRPFSCVPCASLSLWRNGFSLRSRMMLRVHALQPVQCSMLINLRGRDVGMSEDRLHSAQVRAVLHHMCRATMT